METKDILIVYGPRQVGKTTLLNSMLKKNENAMLLNCEIPSTAAILESKDIGSIKALFSGYKIIALDEAQTIDDIGSVLKLIYDELDQFKIIATGSSSFDLANKTGEPLTGRNIKFIMFPLSIAEIKQTKNWPWFLEKLNEYLIYGTYPGIIELSTQQKKAKLYELSADYLYKDVLIYEKVKSPSVIRRLLQSLAFQVGSQVSVNELSNSIGISRNLVETYLDLLEKTFVIFRIGSYSNNLRNEIKKSQKFYFHDNGILNAIISNFTPIHLRNDVGALFENYCMSERLKFNLYNNHYSNMYFWRTYDGAEIDLVEEKDGSLKAFEFKWNVKRKSRIPESFRKQYKTDEMQVITAQTLHNLIA